MCENNIMLDARYLDKRYWKWPINKSLLWLNTLWLPVITSPPCSPNEVYPSTEWSSRSSSKMLRSSWSDIQEVTCNHRTWLFKQTALNADIMYLMCVSSWLQNMSNCIHMIFLRITIKAIVNGLRSILSIDVIQEKEKNHYLFYKISVLNAILLFAVYLLR